jgi:two-component system chemotaxis response regulator CheY
MSNIEYTLSKAPTMRSLVVEDEFTGRMQLPYFLKGFGECDVALDGIEAIRAFLQASTQGNPYP